MRVKKVNIFKNIELENFSSIETIFFLFTKIHYFIYALLWPARTLKNSFILED